MTIEIISPHGDFLYRQRPKDKCVIESKRNKRNARWIWIGHYETPEEAKAALWAIEAAWRRQRAEEGDGGEP